MITDLKQRLKEAYISPPDEAANIAVWAYKLAKDRERIALAGYAEVKAEAKTIITDLMIELQVDRIETESGTAYVPRPGATVSYNAKELDRLCEADPTLAAQLSPYRVVKEVPGSLTVR